MSPISGQLCDELHVEPAREPLTNHPIVRAVPDFEGFYVREYREVLGLAFVLCGTRPNAEELAQDAFLAAFERWDEVGRMDRPGAWVRQVVANRSASRFRRLAAEGRALVRFGSRSEAPSLSPDGVAVWSAIRRLSSRQAEVTVLVFYAGMSHSEVAALLNCSIETVRTHLKRAKVRLRRWLEVNE